MRASLAPRLRCAVCRTAALTVTRVDAEDEQEIREGALTCGNCSAEVAIDGGIVELLHDPPDFVSREAAGLDRFAQTMRDDNWTRKNVTDLPDGGGGYWWSQAVLMDQTLEQVPFAAGETILDVGSNTCWASAAFAKHGLDVTALDIARTLMQGLETADWQFEDKGVFFERVLGVMFDLPFADASFDNVWCCEVLHHNHRANLARTYEEIFRILKPGGRLIVANEPLRTVMTPKINPGHEVAEYEGHEHAYMRFSYTTLARRAGFELDVRGPRLHPTFQGGPITLTPEMSVPDLYRAATVIASRRSPRLRKAMLAALAYVVGGTSLHMVATKPA